MFNYLLILYTPGYGGNHLGHLISLAFHFDIDRLPNTKEEILKIYTNSLKVHGNLANMQRNHVVKKMKQKPPITLVGHFGEFLKDQKLFNSLKSKKFIIINAYDCEDEIPKLYYRLENLGYSWHKDMWFCWEQYHYYKIENISKHLNCDASDIVSVTLPEIFNPGVLPLLEKLSSKLDLPIIGDVEFCQEIHKLWLENNKIGL